MTYDETKAYLSQYYYAYQKVDSLKEELRCLEELANGTQGINYDEPVVQKSRSLKAPFIRYIDRIQRKEEELSKKVEELLNLKDEIHEAIVTVNDPVMELVLTYRYINFWEWCDIASKLHYAESYVYKLHRKAISLVLIKEDSKRQ